MVALGHSELVSLYAWHSWEPSSTQPEQQNPRDIVGQMHLVEAPPWTMWCRDEIHGDDGTINEFNAHNSTSWWCLFKKRCAMWNWKQRAGFWRPEQWKSGTSRGLSCHYTDSQISDSIGTLTRPANTRIQELNSFLLQDSLSSVMSIQD